MFTLAHLSDLHATTVRIRHVRQLLNKRVLGWLSWTLSRRKEHRSHVLEALLEDLRAVGPDHVAVTGDLTNLGLEEEFQEAVVWLERLGPAARVSVVPGNHDAYVAVPQSRSWDLWTRFMASGSGDGDSAGEIDFPSVRIHGPIALIGLSSARPTPPLVATGRLGREQRERLELLLTSLGAKGLCRVVLIHHPPKSSTISRRRHLSDAPQLCATLERVGAELVLHGHTHRSARETLMGPDGPIPVMGVRSASAIGHDPERRAQYHLYGIEPGANSEPRRFRVSCSVRAFDPATGRFVSEGEQVL